MNLKDALYEMIVNGKRIGRKGKFGNCDGRFFAFARGKLYFNGSLADFSYFYKYYDDDEWELEEEKITPEDVSSGVVFKNDSFKVIYFFNKINNTHLLINRFDSTIMISVVLSDIIDYLNKHKYKKE